jgi:hypothetical protein
MARRADHPALRLHERAFADKAVPMIPMGEPLSRRPFSQFRRIEMPSSKKTIPRYRPAEPPDEFASLYEELEQEIQPKGVIERTYVSDIASILWQIKCLRRYKTHIINSSRNEALGGILRPLLWDLDFPDDPSADEIHQIADDLVRRWFDEDAEAKTEVGELLRKFQMDEGAIEAEAFMMRLDDIERLDRLLAALEFRRDKALSCVAGYRQLFSKRLQQSADRILDNDEEPRLIRIDRTMEGDNGKQPAD